MKKIVSFILATILILAMISCESQIEPIETEEPCPDGHVYKIKYTNTCESDGYKIYTCSGCGLTEQKKAKAIGHSFEKNTCKNCDFEAKTIEQLPLEYRKEIAKKLKQVSLYYSDLDTLCAVADLYVMTLRDIKNDKKAIQEAVEIYNSVPMVMLYQDGKWVYVKKEPYLTQAKNELDRAKQKKAKDEELFELLKISIETNAEGAAFNSLIEEMEAETTSDKKIASRILAVLFAYSLATDNTDPEWIEKVYNVYTQYTGLEIDVSKALS